MKSNMRGMTLIELMVVIVVVAVLAGIAIPSYRSYVMRAQRSDATAALLRVAAAQEKFYLQNNTYASDAQLGLAPPAGLGVAATEHGWYALSIASPDLARGYTAQATAPAGSPQHSDSKCRTFSITDTGLRSAADAGGTSNATVTTECWR